MLMVCREEFHTEMFLLLTLPFAHGTVTPRVPEAFLGCLIRKEGPWLTTTKVERVVFSFLPVAAKMPPEPLVTGIPPARTTAQCARTDSACLCACARARVSGATNQPHP